MKELTFYHKLSIAGCLLVLAGIALIIVLECNEFIKDELGIAYSVFVFIELVYFGILLGKVFRDLRKSHTTRD
jgi:hypothetical protein